MTTVAEYLSRSNIQLKFRLYFKRLLVSTGLYETEWVEITPYVVQFPAVSKSMGDNIALSEYLVASSRIVLDSTMRTFADSSDPLSAFFIGNGYLSRYKTKYKLSTFIIEDDDTELNVDNNFYISSGEPQTGFNNAVTISVQDMLYVLKTESADGTALTGDVDNMISQVLEIEDGSGNRIFDRFCEGAIDADRYVIPSSSVTVDGFTVADQESVFDTIKKLCTFIDGYIFFNTDGNFEVKVNRDATASSQWTFNAYAAKNDYGVNVSEISMTDGTSKIYNTSVIKYGATLASSVSSTTSFTVGDGSARDIHGQKIFTADFKEVTTAPVAQAIADIVVTNRAEPKRIFYLKASPAFLAVSDKVTLNSEGPHILGAEESPIIFGVSEFDGSEVFTDFAGAINVSGLECKVLSMSYNPNSDVLAFNFMVEEV